MLRLALALLAPLAASAQPAAVDARAWTGTVSVVEAGALSGSETVDGETRTGSIRVSNRCEGPVRLAGGDGAWDGTADLTCTIDGAQESSRQSREGGGSVTSAGAGRARRTVPASLQVDRAAGTYSFHVEPPEVPVATTMQASGGISVTDSSTASGFTLLDRSSLVEGRPLPGRGALAGTLTEPLPGALALLVPGGADDAFTRTITWTLTPDGAHPCDGTPHRVGPVGGAAEALREAVAAALRAQGAHATPAYVSVSVGAGGRMAYAVRLGRGHRPLPTAECIGAADSIPAGSQEGAVMLLLGSLQQVGTTTRVTARTVEVETGHIVDTGRADAAGTGPEAVREAAEGALGALGVPFGGG